MHEHTPATLEQEPHTHDEFERPNPHVHDLELPGPEHAIAHGELGHVCTAECEHTQQSSDKLAEELFGKHEHTHESPAHGEIGHICDANCEHTQAQADKLAEDLFDTSPSESPQKETFESDDIEGNDSAAHTHTDASTHAHAAEVDTRTRHDVDAQVVDAAKGNASKHTSDTPHDTATSNTPTTAMRPEAATHALDTFPAGNKSMIPQVQEIPVETTRIQHAPEEELPAPPQGTHPPESIGLAYDPVLDATHHEDRGDEFPAPILLESATAHSPVAFPEYTPEQVLQLHTEIDTATETEIESSFTAEEWDAALYGNLDGKYVAATVQTHDTQSDGEVDETFSGSGVHDFLEASPGDALNHPAVEPLSVLAPSVAPELTFDAIDTEARQEARMTIDSLLEYAESPEQDLPPLTASSLQHSVYEIADKLDISPEQLCIALELEKETNNDTASDNEIELTDLQYKILIALKDTISIEESAEFSLAATVVNTTDTPESIFQALSRLALNTFLPSMS